MKKLIASILAAALFCSMSVAVFAASSIESVNGTDSADVKGTYRAGSASATVYSVDIEWGSMEFTYTAGSAGTWNPETHTNDGGANGVWSAADNTVTVTNHSNAAVDAVLSYVKEAAYADISGSFAEISGTSNDGKLELATAVGTDIDDAPTATAELKLDGELASGVTDTKIGTITVTITEHTTSGAQDGGFYGRG